MKWRKKTYNGAVQKIGVLNCFKTHTYKYGETLFKTGGKGVPFDSQITVKLEKMRMICGLRKLKKVLDKSGINWETMFIYVDDWRAILRALKKESYILICAKI